MPYTFRPAVGSDIQAIADIYNASVMAGGATADLTRAPSTNTTPGSNPIRRPTAFLLSIGRRFNHRLRSALSVFYDRAGYDGVTDFAYYIAPASAGQGSGHLHTGQTA